MTAAEAFIVGIVAGLVGLLLGIHVGLSQISRDCDALGKFRNGKDLTYICAKQEVVTK